MKSNRKKTKRVIGIIKAIVLCGACSQNIANAQIGDTYNGSSTNNSTANNGSANNNGSYTTGNANPSASVSTATTGGTNINYQTNNSWNNEQGFGPGIFCRSPTFYMGVSSGQNTGNVNDTTGTTTNSYSGNYSGNIGVLVPFGSSVNQDCKELVKQIVLDRRISNQLSMIRACAALEREGIKVDPEKYPLLAICVNTPKPNISSSESKPNNANLQKINTQKSKS